MRLPCVFRLRFKIDYKLQCIFIEKKHFFVTKKTEQIDNLGIVVSGYVKNMLEFYEITLR